MTVVTTTLPSHRREGRSPRSCRLSGECSSRFATLTIGALTGCLATACSFVSSTLPPSAPDQRTAKAAAGCGSIAYPLLDTSSTFAGLSWVFYANWLEEDSKTRTYNVTPGGGTTVESVSAPTASYDAIRVLGYGTMALFGASSIYGYYAAWSCASLRHEIAERKKAGAAADTPRVLAHPPKDIAGFTFDMTQTQAEQACVAKRQAWHLEGAVALCTPAVESHDALPFRLEFQAGELHKVTVVRRIASEQLLEDYDTLYAGLRTMFGPPQVERATLVGSCSGALAECMKNGEKPKGPVWSWPTTTLELQPVWQGDHPVLEERYTHLEELKP